MEWGCMKQSASFTKTTGEQNCPYNCPYILEKQFKTEGYGQEKKSKEYSLGYLGGIAIICEHPEADMSP